MAQVTQAQEAQEVQDNNLQLQLQVVLGKVLEIQEDIRDTHQAGAAELLLQVNQAHLQDKVFNMILHHQQHPQCKHTMAVVEREDETAEEALLEVKAAELLLSKMMVEVAEVTSLLVVQLLMVNLDIVQLKN